MNTRIVQLAVALAFLACATALGQRADPNTGGPTKNTLGMKLIQPQPDATITGDVVQITVGYNTTVLGGAGQGSRFGDPNFPQPRFNVYLDNDLKTTLKGTESNVATIHGVAPGTHKITVVAVNVSGEVIDRKEISIQTVPPALAVEKPAKPASAAARMAPPPPPAPEPAPAPPAVPEEKVLPTTASSYPALALAGLLLVATGLILGRRAR